MMLRMLVLLHLVVSNSTRDSLQRVPIDHNVVLCRQDSVCIIYRDKMVAHSSMPFTCKT